ncbi:nucleotidyltransferase [Bacillus sp. BGMRC 2118]|nr:nucleotidyltransferase [Bacillus sp. BGMRC 2118]
MTIIKNIGRLCPTNENGTIQNDSSHASVPPEFRALIEDVIEKYIIHLETNLHSVYIRGSIPRGVGIYGVSDLDTIAIVRKKVKHLDLSWVEEVEQTLNAQYECVNGVEFSFYYIEDILAASTFSIIPFMLKTHSICVAGADVRPMLPDYKADRTLGNEHLVNLATHIERAKEDLDGNEDPVDIMDCCTWIMKIIVRAGLALVIEKEHRYTRDLYPAYQLFSNHYPEKSAAMRQAVMYAIQPIENPHEITSFLYNMGHWMIHEAEKWLQIYNPKKDLHMKLLK